MLTGENIVCFAKDWTEDPTSNNHVMRLLSKKNKVLWLNSISTRTPDFKSSSDLQKIGRKLKSFAQGPKTIEDHLKVYTPIVLPFPHNPAATLLNRQILKASIGLLRQRLGMQNFQLWSFIPTASQYVGKLGESLSVYYCTDEWSQFSYVDSAKIVEMEKELCRKVDIVFTTARTLLERKRAYNPETYLASHGVDYAHFAKSMDASTPIAPEIANLPKPVLGFIGLIEDWIDLDLIAAVAQAYPSASVVLIGKEKVDTSRLKKYPNIHLLGRKPYAELPKYCKGFDVGLIPFAINELTRNVNPIKLREYFSAGLPVVSTDIPEVRFYDDSCCVAKTHAEFVAGVGRVLEQDSPEARIKRRDAMKKETWDQKVEDLGNHILHVMEKKGLRAKPATSSANGVGRVSL